MIMICHHVSLRVFDAEAKFSVLDFSRSNLELRI